MSWILWIIAIAVIYLLVGTLIVWRLRDDDDEYKRPITLLDVIYDEWIALILWFPLALYVVVICTKDKIKSTKP